MIVKDKGKKVFVASRFYLPAILLAYGALIFSLICFAIMGKDIFLEKYEPIITATLILIGFVISATFMSKIYLCSECSP